MMKQDLEQWKKERTYTIRLVDGVFLMEYPEGTVIRGGTPRTLASSAWAKGAWSVVFDFDLNLDPDKQR